jgi:lysozyme
MYKGIDVSAHQGVINVKSIRDAGYKRIIIRAGYGKNNIDQKFVSNAQACVNLNEDAGIYWFSYGYTEAMANNEAEYAIAAAKKYWSKCPVAFDLEYDTVRYARTKGVEISKTLASKMAVAFLKVVVQDGFIPVLYTNRDYAKNYFDIPYIEKEIGTKLHVWYALYSSNIGTYGEALSPSVWQYSSKGKVPGISGNVDMNEFYTDFDVDMKNEVAVENKCNINILNFQKAANADGYRDADGNKLIEDGIDGPKTQYVRKKVVLKARLNLFVGSTGSLVSYWERRLTEMGFAVEITGKFGKNNRAATIKCQKKLGCKADGCVGYNTLSQSFYN